MRRTALFLLSAFALLALSCSRLGDYEPKSGDILFQDLESPQSQAVKLATGSEYTHCGIVFQDGDNFVVYEAVGPVRIVPLDDWIAQGVGATYEAKRLTPLGKYLTPGALAEMREYADSQLGKPYDLVFNWSNDEIYCSEYVWKIYYEAFGLELTPLRRLGSYDLSHEAVQTKLRERYGDDVPRDEPVVSPADLFESEHLYTVF